MPDDLTKREPQDKSKIALHEPYEVNWWCHKFSCSKSELTEAVHIAGHGAKAVEEHFRKNPPKR